MSPFGVFVYQSFLTNLGFTRAGQPFTLDNYVVFLTSGGIEKLAFNSLRVGLATAVATVVLGLAVAYWLRYSAGRLATPVLLLVVATLFASYLVRVYAWRIMLGDNGVINSGLQFAGVIDQPLDFLIYDWVAVVIAETNLYLPLMVLLLYGGFRPLEASYLEAARDLGAGPLRLWLRVILPAMSKPIALAFVLVFMFASSDWLAPTYLGGRSSGMLSVQAQAAFTMVGNWAGGAAICLAMVAGYVVLYVLVMSVLRLAGLWNLRWVI